MIDAIQPLKITRNNIRTRNSQQRKISFTNKFDEVELSTKPKMSKAVKSKVKKALTAASNATERLAIKSKVASLTHEVDIKDIQKQASVVQENGQKVVDEFMERFKDIQPSGDGIKVIEEYTHDDKTLARYATLDSDNFLTINDYVNKIRIKAVDGQLTAFDKKSEISQDSTAIKAKESFIFINKESSNWAWFKNIQTNEDHSGLAKMGLEFENGKLSQLVKNAQRKADGSYSCEIQVLFEDGKLSEWGKNLKSDTDGYVTAEESELF